MEPRKLPVLKNYEFVTTEGIPCNLGFGAYGSVQLGKCLKTGQTVAIKKIGRKIALNEVEIHMKLNHPNVIKMLDYYFDQKQQCTYIILEYAENGTLFDYIHENGLKDKKMTRAIFQSVCEGINYMHSKNIMHRDIKPENILLGHKYTVKVCDFGFSVNCQPRMTLCGTVQYMAPQMILRKPYTHKIDIWGLGILLFQMIEGRAPFQGQTQQEVLEKMKKPIFFSKNFTEDQIELVHKILRVNPAERPEIIQILKSPCLRRSIKVPDDINNNNYIKAGLDMKKLSKNSQQKISITTSTTHQKRSTDEKQKKIKIIQVIDLQTQKPEKTEKKNSYNIEITSIRDLQPNQHPHFSYHENGTKILEKLQKTGPSYNTIPGNNTNALGKQKISLKKVSQKRN